LPLDLGIKIDPDDEVVSFLKALEGVNLNKYLKRNERRGRKGYDNVMLLKVVLFARMIGESHLRNLESLCKHDIRFMYIMNEQTPSFMSFERLLNDYLIDDIDDIYFEVTENICRIMDVNKSIQYIDGTKIEANANKYSFVYKTRILNARMKLFSKITHAIIEMNMERGFDFSYHYFYCAQEIGYIAQYLMELMVSNDIVPVYGKGKRKTDIQRWYDLFLEYYMKLDEYEFWLFVIGNDRNSCSKTDFDATMFATKMDYYCNTGLSRPCYNVQIAVSDGIIVNADLYQKAADVKTFIPFMKRYKKFTGEYPQYPMGDAGYGSEDNYMYCLTHGMNLVMKYSMYAKKNEPKFKKKEFNPYNWGKDENGYKVCPNGHIFDHDVGEIYDESGEYLKIKQKMTSGKSCEGCPYMEECCRSRNHQKTLTRDAVLDEFYAVVDENLSTEFGKELKKQRSIQVEGAFGVIKQDMKFVRFTRRGLENAKMEFLIVCLGYNFKKYHNYRLRKEKESRQRELLN
jgi:transposase